MKIKCIIIEDEPLAQKLLQDYIKEVDFLHLQKTFNNPLDALTYLKENKIDLIFLDIEMPKLSGMDFLDVLDNSPQIIFTTAYSNYAVKSYEKNALDYLLKPITFERFLAAINKHPFLKSDTDTINENADGKSIFIKSNKNLIRLDYTDICFVEGLKDYVLFNTVKTKHIVYHTLKKLEDILPSQFIRAHNSYIINLDKIEKIKDNHVYISNLKVPIGSKYRENLLDKVKRRTL